MVHATRNEGSTVMATYLSLPNKLASAVNGIDYAYRDAGEGPVPLVLLQHFRGNLDNWDPALIDALRSSLSLLALIALIALFTTRRIPARQPSSAPGQSSAGG